MSADNDESGLISKAVAGDATALELLLYRYRKQLLDYVRSHFPEELRGLFEPQDILQDTWLRAIRGVSEFRPGTSDTIYRWLVTIARNLIADHLKYVRTRKRAGNRVLTDGTHGNDSIIRLLEELATYRRTPSKSAASHELMAAVESAIERLPFDQARAVRLRYLDGMETKNIADLMQRTEGSISMLCNRGLKVLRVELRSASFYI